MKRQYKTKNQHKTNIPFPDYDIPSWRRSRLGAIIDFFDFDSVLIIPLPTKKGKSRPPLIIFKHLGKKLKSATNKAGKTHPSNHLIFWENKELLEIPKLFKTAYGSEAIDSLYQTKFHENLKDNIIEAPIKLFQMKGNKLDAKELKEAKKYLRYFCQLHDFRGRNINISEHKLILNSAVKVIKRLKKIPKKLPMKEILDSISKEAELTNNEHHEKMTNISQRTVSRSINNFLMHLSCFRHDALYRIKDSNNTSALISNYLKALPKTQRETKPPLKLRS